MPPERVPPAQLRELCLALPDVEERLSHGEPAWFVRGRLFVTLADHHHDDRVAFWAAAPEGAQEALVASGGPRRPQQALAGDSGSDEPRDWPASANDREGRAAFDFSADAVYKPAKVGHRDPHVVGRAGHDADPRTDPWERLPIHALTSFQSQIGPAASSTFGAGKSG